MNVTLALDEPAPPGVSRCVKAQSKIARIKRKSPIGGIANARGTETDHHYRHRPCMQADGHPDFALTEVEVTHDEFENGMHYFLAEASLRKRL